VSSFCADVLLYVGAGFFGMLAVAYGVIWAAEKWLTKRAEKAGKKQGGRQ
jgi:hypothetical protein